jgi:competence protein ComEA
VSRPDRLLIAAAGSAILMAAAAGWVLVAAPPGEGAEASDAALVLPTADPDEAASSASAEPAATTLVVDVEGAVAAPGVRELPAGARVADALAAAGGYAADADLEAAAASINLAQRLEDGVQIVVPRVGASAAAALGEAAGGESGGGAGGPVNLNTASPEELEALPGIGPVTVERIIAARDERPFASLEDAVARGAIDRGQAEDIEGLATAS